MQNFVAVSFCVLAALASSTHGDATCRSRGIEVLFRVNDTCQSASSQHEIESDISKPCCHITELERYLHCMYNDTEPAKHEAYAAINHITWGCKGEPDTIRNAPSRYAELRKAFNDYDTKDILEDERILERKVNMLSCNAGDYTPLLPMLMGGNEDEKFAAYELIMISTERCKEKYIPGNKEFSHCDLEIKKEWQMFFQWLVEFKALKRQGNLGPGFGRH